MGADSVERVAVTLRLLLCVLLVAPVAFAQGDIVSSVLNSQHNLTSSGPGPVTSSDTRPCIFCHISHGGYTVTSYLWNHPASTATYTPYQSTTMNAPAGNPATGISKLCLSCHDGTVALSQTVAAGTIPVSGSMASDDLTGPDLSRHHPVAIRPVDDGQVYPGLAQTPAVSADPAVKLPGNQIECITCHDPHVENRDATRRRFLVRSNQNSALCQACHDPTRPPPSVLNGWVGSAHQIATNARSEYYGNVAADACLSCHRPHNSITAVPLLRASEENACAVCHAGSGTSPALLSVMSEFSAPYAHPTTTLSGLHTGGENAYPLNSSRHAECADCHSPHAAQLSVVPPSSTPPALSPALTGATGVDGLSGVTALRPAANEYEICFKCHANSTNKPQVSSGYVAYGRTPRRVTDQTVADPFNARLEFNSPVSRHNVTYPRQRTNSEVPSLRSSMLRLNGAAGRSLAPGTYIYCGDCHNNDQARNSGGGQASGVHGASWPHILERRYETEPPPATPGGSTPGVVYQAGLNGTYALCYKCHDIDGSTLQDRSFGEHRKHVEGVDASCSTCHDAHGINGGNSTNNYALINFDTTIVGPPSSGTLRYERTGQFQGRCYLRCHNVNHNPKSY